MHRTIAAALLALAATLSQPALASCGSAFCTVNTDWHDHDAFGGRGARAGLRFEYVDQDQPQTGTRKIAVGEIPAHHDEVRTLNRNWIASLDYGFDDRWSLSVALPLVSRSHEHIHHHLGAQIPESWQFAQVGDLRLLGRYQLGAVQSPGAGESARFGLLFGLKLPTGRFDVRNADGELAERTLQPGSGTTDALAGAYYRRELPRRDLSWFVQGLAQLPLAERAGFRPGARLGLDLGTRYEASERLALLLQANLLLRGRDAGAEAEPGDSGGRALWLSPGLSYALGRNAQAYGFLQKALYQYVNGVQLVADTAVVLGLGASF
jgi:hypothetical protein